MITSAYFKWIVHFLRSTYCKNLRQRADSFEVLKESDFLVHSRVISQEDIRKHEILNLGLWNESRFLTKNWTFFRLQPMHVYLEINYDSSVLNLKLIAPRCAVFNQFY